MKYIKIHDNHTGDDSGCNTKQQIPKQRSLIQYCGNMEYLCQLFAMAYYTYFIRITRTAECRHSALYDIT